MSGRKVKYPAPKLNAFKFKHKRGYTMNMGGLYPCLCEYLMPNSRIKFRPTHKIKALALTAPIMDNVKAISYYFKIPLRLLAGVEEEYSNYMTGGKDDDDNTPTPVINSGENGWDAGSLLDYLGYTTNYYDDTGSLVTVPNFTQNAWALRAYNLVVNECFINTNITSPRTLSKGWGLDTTTDTSLFYHSWGHDRFVNAMPSLLRGDPVYLPLGTEADVSVYGNGKTIGLSGKYSQTDVDGKFGLNGYVNVGLENKITTSAGVYGEPIGTIGTGDVAWKSLGLTDDPDNSGIVGKADLTSATEIDVNELRNTIALGFAKNLSMYIGTHLSDWIYGVFGCRPSDGRLQRPEFLGKCISPLYVDEVEQTSSTDDVSPQGHLAGKAMTLNGDKVISVYADEPCILLGLISLIPEGLYFQGSRRWMNYMSRYDYPNPLYAKISDQAIFEKEIFAQADNGSTSVTYTDPDTGEQVTTTVTNNTIYGFEPRFNEVYNLPNTIHGDLKTNLKFWTVAREWKTTEPPMLNDDMIYASQVTDRVFPVLTHDVNKFIVKSYFEGRMIAPLPADALPSSLGVLYGV